jgi:hypothetical protein
MSVSGQNERWAQLNAYPPPPRSRAGQNGGLTSTGGTTDPSVTAGGASNALSDGMSLALMAFNGADGTEPAGSSTSSGTTDPASTSQSGSGPGSQLLTDIQSLMTALTGSAGTATGSISNGTTLDSAALQDLQTVESDLGSLASASPANGLEAPQSQGNNGISNTGTATGDWGHGFQQQFALSAYGATALGTLDVAPSNSITA